MSLVMSKIMSKTWRSPSIRLESPPPIEDFPPHLRRTILAIFN